MRQTLHGWAHEACAARLEPAPAGAYTAGAGATVGKVAGIGCAGLCVVAALILGAVSGSRKGAPKPEAKRSAPVQHTVAAEYRKDNAPWEAVVVPRGTSDAQLCELAKWLHGERWNTRFHLFDDGTRVGEFTAWTQAYPAYQRPKALVDWMAAHHRGMVRQETQTTWRLHTVTGDSPASRAQYPCEFAR